MPIEYEVRPEALHLCTVGDVDYHEGLAVFEAAVAAARAQPTARLRTVVFDIRRSEEQRSAGELRR